MKKIYGKAKRFGSLAVMTATKFLLAGCSKDGRFSLFQPTSGNEDTVTSADNSIKLIERDVEAPDVFQITDKGLWDGRPSLGGVWVAHPDVGEPERVCIRNTTNDKFVISALFRCERENPGPILQVSSDAAAAPATLNVTALRHESAPDPAATAPARATSTLEKLFIQIGIFSFEENARNTAVAMRQAGMIPTVKQQSSQGKSFWRVIAGPASNTSERGALLKKITGVGFDDAYPLTN